MKSLCFMKTQCRSDSSLPQHREEENPGGHGAVGTWLFVGCATMLLSATAPNCPVV